MKCRTKRGWRGQPAFDRRASCGWRSCRAPGARRARLGPRGRCCCRNFLNSTARWRSVQRADHLAAGEIERGVQAGGAVPLVVVGRPRRGAGQHRQDRCGAVERLDLALLIDAQHHRALGRGEVEADDVAHLVDEQRIARELPGLDAGAAAGRTRARSARPRSATARPAPPSSGSTSAWRPSASVSSVRTITSSTWASLIVRGPPRPRLVQQPVEAIRQVPPTPLADRIAISPRARAATSTILPASGARQHDPRPRSQRIRGRRPARPALQLLTLPSAQNHILDAASHAHYPNSPSAPPS